LAGEVPSAVVQSDPKLVDRRALVEKAWTTGKVRVLAADAALDKIWKEDDANWRLRLTPFLSKLGVLESNAFARLVNKGCQPDRLAHIFHEAANPAKLIKAERRIHRDVAALRTLTKSAAAALVALSNRRRDFDNYLAKERIRITEDETGTAELNLLRLDFESFAKSHQAELERIRHQLDGRRQPLLGDAEVKLSRQIYEVTGSYHDKAASAILSSILERRTLPPRTPDALKRKRARWSRMLSNPVGRETPG
jgi:hypothetical protein